MALSFKNSEVDRLARELSEVTGETITEAVIQALKERLERETKRLNRIRMREEIKEIQNRINKLSCLDEDSDEDIIGYNEEGYSV